jgi:hypothetical protein
MIKLKPCPYCGAKQSMLYVDTECLPNGINRGFVECCEADCWAFMYGKNEKHAIKMWNKRSK